MSRPTDHSTGKGLDRRDVLKKTALVGGIAWAAPVVTATNAWASNGVCTPRCEPTGGATVTGVVARKIGCVGEGGLGTLSYEVDFDISYTSTVDCKCAPDPAATGTQTVRRTIPDPGAEAVDVDLQLLFQCPDTTGDLWVVVCEFVINIEITGNCQPQTGTVRINTTDFVTACRNECLIPNQTAS